MNFYNLIKPHKNLVLLVGDKFEENNIIFRDYVIKN